MSDYIYIKSYLIISNIIIRDSLDFTGSQEWRIVNFPLELCVHAFISFENQDLEVLLTKQGSKVDQRTRRLFILIRARVDWIEWIFAKCVEEIIKE